MTCMSYLLFFFFNDTATTEIYTLSLHDALPISGRRERVRLGLQRRGRALRRRVPAGGARVQRAQLRARDRKSTRLNSSHANISYAVFCLKKKKKDVNVLISHRDLICSLVRFHPV